MPTVRQSPPTRTGSVPAASGATAAPGAATRVRAAPVRLTDRGRSLLAYLVAGLGALLGGAWSQRLASADLRVPFEYSGDAVATSAHVKTVLETGWYERQPLLGAPAGQTYHDFPTADNLHLVIAKALGWVLGDWATTFNVYFLVGFPLAALAAMAFLRAVGVERTFAVAMAYLFAMAPYHFLRGESHLWLASYYPVPLAMLLVLRALRGQPLWGLRRGGPRAVLTSRAVGTVLIAALVASASSYYAVFTLALLGLSGLVSFVHRRDWRRFAGAACAGVVVVVVMLLNMAPDILWARENGTNAGAFDRSPQETEVYALKISSLLLPVPQHTVGRFAELRQWYDERYPLPSEQPALGLVAAAGLLVLLGVAVLHLMRPLRDRPEPGTLGRSLVELASLVVVALLFSTVGGLSTLISFATPQLRGWNRMSIVISLLCLAAVGIVMGASRRRLARATGPRAAVVAGTVVAVLSVAGGTVDQVPQARRPDHAATRSTFVADEEWVTEVERTFGGDATVAQLPFIRFPESPAINGVFDSDQLRPYLHSATLRWSGGGIKGRASSDWASLLDAADAPVTSTGLAAAGFDAVVLDRPALVDRDAEISGAWRATVGEPVVVGNDGRYEVYDLRPVRAALEERYEAPVIAAAGETVTEPTLYYHSPVEIASVPDEDGGVRLSSEVGAMSVVVDNARDERPAPVRMTFRLPGDGEVYRVRWPDGTSTEEGPGPVSRDLAVPPGRTTWTVERVDGEAPLTVGALTLTVTDGTVLEPPSR